jgi:hypothetical protein
MDDRRTNDRADRRAHPRGGRRDGERRRPWYVRRRVWLAVASVLYMGWRRVRRLKGDRADDRPGMAA